MQTLSFAWWRWRSRTCLRRVRYAAWDRDIASLADDGGTTNRHS